MTVLAQPVFAHPVLAQPVLAHGGGAPEAAMIGLPLLVLVVFGLLERRARKREREQSTPD